MILEKNQILDAMSTTPHQHVESNATKDGTPTYDARNALSTC
jgi:hypothetical protein